ncbi:10428_t:CDS:2, partial [Paraglomus occultum]
MIDFQIRKNPSFDLVLGQEWLWMHKAKIIFGFSPKTYEHRDKIVIDEEITNTINKILSDVENNKHRKRRHGIFHITPPAPPLPRRLNGDFSKNNRASKIKKYPKVDLGDGCGKLSIKTHLNNIWKSVHSIENDI